ncbi:hypothetical protein GUJ93_ZPchr0001g32122 [Zizania palustris]|uniref:Uncharacterized protein n=1 Tax=Zizania palustris TaxID=103762 RepID=A0A8J5SH10_ZIZPA|nr:hypothetical protein GUJ93_ZPchr0001g32122 [Zizania palustris]
MTIYTAEQVSRHTCTLSSGEGRIDSPGLKYPFFLREEKTPDFSSSMSNPKSQGKHGGGLGRMLKEHKARLYIIRRCVVMLLCNRD